MNRTVPFLLSLIAVLATAVSANAQVSFKDPTGDDNGPGTYTYPTDAVYKRGSFDITAVEIKSGNKTDFAVTVNSNLEDPWSMGNGFAAQMVFIFIDTDNKGGGGFTTAPPGLNVTFDPKNAWEKCVILSPQPVGRVKKEIEQKGGSMAKALIVPLRTKGAGRTITGTVDITGWEGDPKSWGYQVLMQSNDWFPSGNDLLTRKVNEYEGQHRFGGGNDGDCDPHVMDLLAGDAVGDKSEIEAQHNMLKYECNPDGTSKSIAVLTMVHAK